MPQSRPKKPGGRRPGGSGTREAILGAAQACFAENGYVATTIRGVATRAGVDASLLLQFFGSKDGLFDAALRADPPTRELAALVQDGNVANLGERLLRRYLELWESPE